MAIAGKVSVEQHIKDTETLITAEETPAQNSKIRNIMLTKF